MRNSGEQFIHSQDFSISKLSFTPRVWHIGTLFASKRSDRMGPRNLHLSWSRKPGKVVLECGRGAYSDMDKQGLAIAERRKERTQENTQKSTGPDTKYYMGPTQKKQKQGPKQSEAECQKSKGNVHAHASARMCSQNAARRHEPGRTDKDR